MTNLELKKEIKNTLTAAGYKTGYTVSVKDTCYDTAVRIKITDPKINRKEIEKLLHRCEEIARDTATGEILAGANVYLTVEYKDGIFDEEVVKLSEGLYLIHSEQYPCPVIRQQNNAELCSFNVYGSEQLSEFIYKFVTFGTIAA